MALDIPVIATDVTGSRDLVADRASGWLVPVGDVVALEEACHAALVLPLADQQALRVEARHRAARFSHERMVCGVHDVYAELGLTTSG
jgi:glycosyltransferase involved in cell wall biosynthesis